MSSKARRITTTEILTLYDAHEGRIGEFIRFSTKISIANNGSLWNNVELFINGKWTTEKYDLEFDNEKIAYCVAPLTAEDAAIMTKTYKYKTAVKHREEPKYMQPTMQFNLYPGKINIDPKTGQLEEGNELPTIKSKLVQVFIHLAKHFEETYTLRINNKQLVTSLKEKDANPGSQKIPSTKICNVIQEFYGENHPTLAGKPMINPVLRVTMHFEKDGSAKPGMYHKNDITAAQKVENENPMMIKKRYKAVPYTFQVANNNGDTVTEPICDRNVHLIPMFSTATVGTIPFSISLSNFGISMPRKFKMLLITESERYKESIEDLLGNNSDSEEETITPVVVSNTDEPNLDGLLIDE